MKKGPRPGKPYAAYPLHAHASGQWSARINGKARFFGVWADPKGALARYLAFMTRQSKSQPNDADRLRKYLAKFNLSWNDLAP